MPTEERATKLIEPLSDTSGFVQHVRSLLEQKLATKKVAMTTRYQGADVYMFGDRQNGYITLVKDGEILYFVRHELVKHNRMQLGRQVLVWRNRHAANSASSVGFASHVFFDYLLPKYHALIADKEQSPDGKQFWEYALKRAFDLGKKAYFLNRRTTPNTLTQLHDFNDVIANAHDLWGEEDGHLRTFAVISDVPLKIKA
jgi:hypothetical protein